MNNAALVKNPLSKPLKRYLGNMAKVTAKYKVRPSDRKRLKQVTSMTEDI